MAVIYLSFKSEQEEELCITPALPGAVVSSPHEDTCHYKAPSVAFLLLCHSNLTKPRSPTSTCRDDLGIIGARSCGDRTSSPKFKTTQMENFAQHTGASVISSKLPLMF